MSHNKTKIMYVMSASSFIKDCFGKTFDNWIIYFNFQIPRATNGLLNIENSLAHFRTFGFYRDIDFS